MPPSPTTCGWKACASTTTDRSSSGGTCSKFEGDKMNFKALAAVAAMLATTSVSAAEIKVLASNGVKEALNELAPAFERQTKHKLVISFGLAAALKRQIEGGERFDLAILPAAALNDLAKQGKVDPRARAAIARSGVGIGIKKGARRPDIRTERSEEHTSELQSHSELVCRLLL